MQRRAWIHGFIAAFGGSGIARAARAAQSVDSLDLRTYGAVGDGIADDTRAIQAAVDAAARRRATLRISAGTFRIDTARGIQLRDHSTITMDADAKLVAAPSPSPAGAVLVAAGVSDISISGGQIVGNRLARESDLRPLGMGLDVRGCARVRVTGTQFTGNGADGVYIGAARGDATDAWVESTDITVSACRFVRNRRQGLSVTGARGVVIEGSEFESTGPARPAAGIDFEPNPGRTVSDVSVTGCVFRDNAGYAIRVGGHGVQRARIERNRIARCRRGGVLVSASQFVWIVDNDIEVASAPGVLVRAQSTDIEIQDNRCARGTTLEIERGSAVRTRRNSCR